MPNYFLNDDFCSWHFECQWRCTVYTICPQIQEHIQVDSICIKNWDTCAHDSNIWPHTWAWQGTSARGSAETRGDPNAAALPSWTHTPVTAGYCWECSMTAALVGGSYRRIMTPSSSQSVSVVQNWHSEVPLPLSWGLNHCKNHMFPEKSALSFLFIRSELSAGVSAPAESHWAQQIK